MSDPTAQGVGRAGASIPPPAETRTLELEFGTLTVALEVVAHPEDFVDARALLADQNAPEPPYWLHAWTGGRALARRIAAEATVWAGRRVIDLGCGLGLPGVAAALLGARVVLADAVHDALVLARRNARRNGVAVDVVRTDLVAAGVRGPFDAVLLADVTYDPALQTALADFLAAHLGPRGVALVAESVRTHDPGFARACGARGLAIEEREVRETEDGRPVPVRLAEVRRR